MEIFKDLFSGFSEVEILKTIAQAGLVVKGVMIVLILFSVVSWGIIFYKFFAIMSARGQSRKFLDAFWTNPKLATLYEKARRYKKSPIAQVFRAGYQEFNRLLIGARAGKAKVDAAGNPSVRDVGSISTELLGAESIERVLRRSIMEEVTRLESHLTFLATTGSTCPFIGLFGTVWGIMNAFRGIGAKSSASIGVVASGISEALIATAFGLFAAIPAVVAYNYYLSKIKVLTTEMDNFSFEFLNIVERHIKRMK
ncbi:MAG: protein TolQ [Deltaproteobacteria bacterium]|uniref:Protein TolQ n=1 Tax=Candidatus Zymogenus saltonus TaxID=2844893 RepID=A0A9D8KIA5_9DELT|nr:protein TolQ [Candidatus Zymogenus saltonus]